MRSFDHKGLLFDDLNFSNFGYGGDPNDVTRLRIGKNKWYDFRLLFRRDKNFWDYNLLANPLNPSTSTRRCHRNFAAFAGSCSSHAGLQPYVVSAISSTTSGWAFRMTGTKVLACLRQMAELSPRLTNIIATPTDAYRIGVDFQPPTQEHDFVRPVPELLQTGQRRHRLPANSGFRTSNGTPVDAGIVWSTKRAR